MNFSNRKPKKLDADYIKRSLSPLDFYKYELPNAPLKSHGWNNGGLCPFHGDNKPGSFRVNLVTVAFKCFACGMGGVDIVAFVMVLHNLDFVDALHKITDEWGIV